MTAVLVIGGGLAGGAAATHLARAGQAVTLIERKAEAHDKVCGEFISGEAVLYLRDLGIDLAALGAVAIDEVRLCAGSQIIATRLPFPAFSLSRRTLDEALLQRASASGADIRRGCSIQFLQRRYRQWIAAFDDGGGMHAAEVFLATGKHDLRGWKRPPGRQGDLVAFKLHWRLSDDARAALGSAVELILFPGGYAGLEPIEDGKVNLCLVVRRSAFVGFGQTWDTLLAALLSTSPHLRKRLAGAQACWPRPLAITAIPYGFVQTEADGLWRLGDQAACIPSFSGDGMAIALHSAQLAAYYYCAGCGADGFQARLARDVADQVSRATLLSQMLVRPLGQTMSMGAARLVPELLGIMARATRIPARRVNETRAERIA